MMRLSVALPLFVGLSAGAIGATSRVSMRVSPLIAFAPANLMVRTQVEPDDANRAVEVIAESSEFYRSSEMPLDGAQAARTSLFEFRSLPAGSYDVRVVVKGHDGRALATSATSIRFVEGSAAPR